MLGLVIRENAGARVSDLRWLVIQHVAWAVEATRHCYFKSCSITASLPRCVIR
jgi:hypothetical protein